MSSLSNPLENLNNKNTDTASALDEQARLNAHYVKYVKPLTEQFEEYRKKSLKKLCTRVCISIVVFIIVSWLLLSQFYLHEPFMWIFAVAIGLIFWTMKPVSDYKSDVKEQVFPKIFNYFGEDFIFNPKQRMSIDSLKRSKLLPYHESTRFDDYVEGTHKGVKLVINELQLTKLVRVNKKTETRTVFRGLMVQLSCHKAFKGHTVVVRDRGGLTNFFSDSFKGLEQVKLEDPRFEKRFDVFSTDQIEARYLLTVGFMERLQELAAQFNNKIQCAFYEDQLLIMLACNKNRFELGSIFHSATFEQEFKKINQEMKQLFAMIEVLKLEQDIGL